MNAAIRECKVVCVGLGRGGASVSRVGVLRVVWRTLGFRLMHASGCTGSLCWPGCTAGMCTAWGCPAYATSRHSKSSDPVPDICLYCGVTLCCAVLRCRDVCGKVLPCGHKCPDICHAGPCAPCQVIASAQCACGDQQAKRPCYLADWHCERTCGKLLACGRHHCDQVRGC